jgi:uncharacterized protein YjbI with pentapeptide repeats
MSLNNTNLTLANLTGANLLAVTLTGAELAGINFMGADLAGANLNHAKGLTYEQIRSAAIDTKTKLPPEIIKAIDDTGGSKEEIK